MESGEKQGDRWLRLGDLAPHKVIVVRCPCGRSVEYHKGFLQRRHRVPSDFLVFDLQFRLRCAHCNARAGFRISIFDKDGQRNAFAELDAHDPKPLASLPGPQCSGNAPT
jgi:hypothetical protein